MTRSIPIEKILDDCMIAWAMNGEALRSEQGYPAKHCSRLGRKYVGKVVKKAKFGDMPYMTREDKITDLLPDGKARMFT